MNRKVAAFSSASHPQSMKIGTVVRKYPSWLSEIHPVQCC